VLEKTLSGLQQSVGFCHNDLQYGNIMIYEETRQVTLIVSFVKKKKLLPFFT
jgi:choline/ethanolamine kinase